MNIHHHRRPRPTSLALQATEHDLHGSHRTEPAEARETFTIVFVAQPHPTPAEVRLRQLLKLALRALGFQCKSVARGDGNAQKGNP